MDQKTGLSALGRTVLVELQEVEETTKSGIVVFSESEKTRESMAQVEAVILDFGTSCWDDQSGAYSNVKVGDRVIIAKYAGMLIDKRTTKDGRSCYRLINDLEVKCLIGWKNQDEQTQKAA
jgi:co-chaperonin GroES (HSP10)